MKASLKFREDQKPLFRAKVPLSILGLPFQSGIAAGESKELCLNLSTFFDSGPSLKVAYRPNDSWNPFSLIVKTGIGNFGSPINAPMTMSAEFNLVGSGNPSFFLHFKPQFGDFSIKKSQSSVFAQKIKTKSNGAVSDDDGLVEVVEAPVLNSGYLADNGMFSGKRLTVLPSESSAAGVIDSALCGVEVSAKTVLPLRNRAVVKFRWGVRFPAELRSVFTAERMNNPTAAISLRKIPLLVMNKIAIEHAADDDSKVCTKVVPPLNRSGTADLADTFFGVKRQVEIVQAENGLLKKAMDDLRSEIAAGKSASAGRAMDSGKYREGDRSASGGKIDRRSNVDKKSSEFNGFAGKAAEGDVSEELKKALMGGTGI